MRTGLIITTEIRLTRAGRAATCAPPYVHVLADALTSVRAIAALLAGRYLGWIWLDPAMGIVGAIVIARWAWTLISETVTVPLDTTDDHVAGKIRGLAEGLGDARIADFQVWRIGPGAHAGIVSVVGALDIDRARSAGG